MTNPNDEFTQLINTAIINSKEKEINEDSFEERLKESCKTPVMRALSTAIAQLSEEKNITRDQAAQEIIETVKELDDIWKDFILLLGMNRFKEEVQFDNDSFGH